jgi:2-aminoadipate transaminase
MPILATPQFFIPPGMIDLSIGQPAMDLLPHALISKAAAHFMGEKDISLLQYGIMQGDASFREELARFLSEHYSMDIEPESLLITAGASQGLDLLCTLFAKPGDTILVEEPSYYLALQIFREHGLKPITVPMDQGGIDIERLEASLKKGKPAFLYCIPAFHNPTGITLSDERRKKLAAVSEAYNLRIIADEVYHLLSYTITPPPHLVAYDKKGSVFSLGSFSKIVAPGLRLGWIQGAPDALKEISSCGLLTSGGGMNPVGQGLLRSILKLRLLDDHLQAIRQSYHKRSQALYLTLQELVPGQISFSPPQGGYFLWLTLPEDFDTNALLTLAKKNKVSFHPGLRFSSTGGLRNSLRLSFSYYREKDLQEGARRMAKAIDIYLSKIKIKSP